MCLYANAFVKSKDKSTLILPVLPEGLKVSTDQIVQAQFLGKYHDDKGLFLSFHDGHCLCQYDTWNDFFTYLEDIRKANGIDKIPAIVFWSDTEYDPIKVIDLDIELDDIDAKPERGTIFLVGVSISRRLILSIGKEISVIFKNGKTLNGILESFHDAEAFGTIVSKDETIYFSAQELKHVDYKN